MSELGFLLSMKCIAKEARSRGRRCHYPQRLQDEALEFLETVEAQGGTLEDAAELMTMHRVTLEGWLDRFTRPPACTRACVTSSEPERYYRVTIRPRRGPEPPRV